MGHSLYLAFFKLTLIVALFHITFADCSIIKKAPSNTSTLISTSSFKDVSQADIQAARSIVEKALEDWAVVTKSRFERPLRNIYTLKDDAPAESQVLEVTPPEITDEIRSAAALIAELDSPAEGTNTTHPYSDFDHKSDKRQADKFWMETIQRMGTQPYGSDPGYKVFRNVITDYNATGNGRDVYLDFYSYFILLCSQM
jgi:hypothetical protein